MIATACRDTRQAPRHDTTHATVAALHASHDTVKFGGLTNVAAKLDSCAIVNRADGSAALPADSGSPHGGNEGAFQTVGTFAVFVPHKLHVAIADTVLGSMSLAWSDCEGCRFSVIVARDSDGTGVDGIVARLLDSQRQVDSANHDPKSTAMQFDEIDGPPIPFVSPTGRGFLIDDDCGDCASSRMLFGRRGYIATVGIGFDDDVKEPQRHNCEMNVIAQSFRWRE